MPIGILWNRKEEQLRFFFKKIFLDPLGVPEEKAEALFSIFRNNAARFSEKILNHSYWQPQGYLAHLGQEFGFSVLSREDLFIPKISAEENSYFAMKELILIPLKITTEEVVLVTANPFVLEMVYEVNHVLGNSKRFTVYFSQPEDIFISIEKVFQKDHADKALYELRYLFPNDSAWKTLSHPQKYVLFSALGIIFGAAVFFAQAVFNMITLVINLIYMVINPFRIFAAWEGFREKEIVEITPKEVRELEHKDLPLYSVFVPLYKEAGMFPALIGHLKKLDYPASKLEVKILLEENDVDTIAEARRFGLFADHRIENSGIEINQLFEPSIQAIIVPRSDVRTKPRACNFALQKASGKYCVIFDAEDRPEPDQLKKAVLAFNRSSKDVICLQAKLSFYNSRQNWLTRFFTLEYLFWFDYYLNGLERFDSPIPLGGTSNHFRTEWLKSIGGWDPYNVTEDADLGMRIYKRNKKVGMINSYTYEEAVSQLSTWIRQRSRWQKGYVQTYLVHMRNPVKLFKKLGPRKFLFFQFVIGGNFFSALVNPVLWGGFLISLFHPVYFWFMSTPWIAALCAANLIFGNLCYIAMHAAAVFQSKKWDLLPWAFAMPFYWFLHSIGAWKGMFQLITRPHYWEKTDHGLAKEDLVNLAVSSPEKNQESNKVPA